MAIFSDSESDSEDETRDNWYSPTSNPASTSDDNPKQSFGLGLSLSYFDGKGQAEMEVCKGTLPDGTSNTVTCKNGTQLIIHDSHL